METVLADTDPPEPLPPGVEATPPVEALPPQLAYVRSGHVQVLLSQDVYGYGYRAVERLVEKLHLKRNPAAAVETAELTPVTAANVDAFARNWEKWLPR